MANEKRLIEANALIKQFDGFGWGGECDGETVLEAVANAPTVDAVEVVHGRWIFGELDVLGQPVHCSVCGWGRDMVNRAMWLQYDGHKFCGNCGAKMDLPQLSEQTLAALEMMGRKAHGGEDDGK